MCRISQPTQRLCTKSISEVFGPLLNLKVETELNAKKSFTELLKQRSQVLQDETPNHILDVQLARLTVLARLCVLRQLDGLNTYKQHIGSAYSVKFTVLYLLEFPAITRAVTMTAAPVDDCTTHNENHQHDVSDRRHLKRYHAETKC